MSLVDHKVNDSDKFHALKIRIESESKYIVSILKVKQP